LLSVRAARHWADCNRKDSAVSARPRGSRRRRLALALVPAAVALAVGAALVHGLVSPGSRRTDLAPPMLPTLHNGDAGQKTGEREFAPARPAPGTATQNSAAQSAAGQAKQALVIPANRLTHATASLEVQVADHSALSRATNKATRIVASLGGYAQSVDYQSSGHRYGSAVLALRVPVGKAQTAIAKLENLGTLLSQQLSTRDLQQQLARQTNRIGSLRRAIAVYEQALQSGTLSASQRVEIQIKLANARHAITQLRKARSGTLASGATADISLTLTTKQRAVMPVSQRKSRFDHMLGSAAGFLVVEGIVVLYALVVLSPVLVLGGLGWALVRERRRRDDRRLLAAS
jgi:hypothetical protein